MAPEAAADDPAETRPGPPPLRRNWTWAALKRRAFALDVLACPRCGGRLRVITMVQNPAVVRTLLAHVGRARSPEAPGPAPVALG